MRFILWLVLGLLLGPSVLQVSPPPGFGVLSQIAGGAFLFLAGWELRFLNILADKRFYLFVFVGSFLIPALAGYFFFEHNFFMAMALGISALPVAIQILKEKGLYGTQLARRAITLASLCDLVAWAALMGLLPAGSIKAWIWSHWMVLGFFLGLLLGRIWQMPQGASWSRLHTWVLAPLFFVGLGWKIDLWNLFDAVVFIQVLGVAVIAKTLGSYLFSRWAGESHQKSWNLAAVLNARGAMEILAAHFAYEAGLISGALFSALVLLGIVTSVMAVPLVSARVEEMSGLRQES